MPELPEVETTRRGLESILLGEKIVDVVVRQYSLRWPIPRFLRGELLGKKIVQMSRRGKYLLALTDTGTLIFHLGMSGCLRVVSEKEPHQKHDHVDIIFSNRKCLRFTDPRRFGAVLWTTEDVMQHPLLRSLGPEPLTKAFNANYLHGLSQNKSKTIKSLIMDSHIVVGVGNIYANEALFQAGIAPFTPAKQIDLSSYRKLVLAIKQILRQAILQGGTTLKDFLQSDGKPGYFKQRLKVYGRGGQNCLLCDTALKEIRIGQRSTVYCPKCQL